MRRIAALVAATTVAAASGAAAGPVPIAQPFEDCLPRADHVPGTGHAYPAGDIELSCWTQDVAAGAGPLQRLSSLAPRVRALRQSGAAGQDLREAEAQARRAVREASEAVDDLARRYQRLSEASSSDR